MEFPYRPELVDEAGRYFDEVVGKIQAADFRIVRVPERKVCKECDLRSLCAAEGIFEAFRRERVDGRRFELNAHGARLAGQVRRERASAARSSASTSRSRSSSASTRAARRARRAQERGLTLFDVWKGDEGETFEEGWRNKLIWGDNKLVMSSLLEQFAGKST